MVGYDKNDTVTSNQKLIAGCISGALARFMSQPLDVVKLRYQLQKKDANRNSSLFSKWFPVTSKIVQEGGITALWAGHTLGQVHSTISVTSQFYIYELSTAYVAGFDIGPKYNMYVRFGCGVLSGCVTSCIVTPIEVVRVRQMIVQNQYKGFLNGAKTVYAGGGILAFYEGLSASLIQMGPAVGISFGVFSFVQSRLLSFLHGCHGQECSPKNYNPQYVLVASTIAGSMAAFWSKTLTYPFDLAKRRLQISSHRQDETVTGSSKTSKNLIKCKKLTECIVATLKVEGPLGLYRGWLVSMYKAQITGIFAFSTYELICYAIR